MRSTLVIALLFATACVSTNPTTTTTSAPPVQAESQPQPAPAETRPMTPGAIPIPARGLSCNSPIPTSATTEQAGIAQENAWIAENYPGAKKVGQVLTTCKGKAADQIDIETANGLKKSLYFDISNWSGKH